MNKPGRIGREGENRVVSILKTAGFTRAKRRTDRKASHDIDGIGIPVEVKRQGTLAIPDWTRKLVRRHGHEWVLFVIPRDRRKMDHPELMVVPAILGAQMLKVWKDEEKWSSR